MWVALLLCGERGLWRGVNSRLVGWGRPTNELWALTKKDADLAAQLPPAAPVTEMGAGIGIHKHHTYINTHIYTYISQNGPYCAAAGGAGDGDGLVREEGGAGVDDGGQHEEDACGVFFVC